MRLRDRRKQGKERTLAPASLAVSVVPHPAQSEDSGFRKQEADNKGQNATLAPHSLAGVPACAMGPCNPPHPRHPLVGTYLRDGAVQNLAGDGRPIPDTPSPRRIWAIADTHLGFGTGRTMDRFGNEWRNHHEKLKRNIEATVAPNDILLLPGDLSWAKKRKDAERDLAFLAALPGIKICCKGNHDFWWESDKPIAYPGLLSPPVILDGGALGIAGSRGWYIPPSNQAAKAAERDRLAIERETRRLQNSLAAIQDCQTRLVIMHYPPHPFLQQIKAAGVPLVAYGHVHKDSLPQDEKLAHDGLVIEGVQFWCVACDRIDFTPRLLLV